MGDFSGFSDRLLLVIEEKKITQVQLACHLGISKHTLTKYLQGRIPETKILFSLSQYFNRPMEWFLNGLDSTVVPFEKIGAKLDPDLQDMINILTFLMHTDDPDLRGWVKVQFKNAFTLACDKIDQEKKQSRVAEEGSTFGA
ncbi:MAG: helix-turn-helix transcriptional regulator [Negativicutes bacterium]|nr:helix-turn-helix transcriptional regulator [Negativicutes bacterium]